MEAGLAFALGAAGWTLLEYVLHRFVFHGPSPTAIGAREHRQHHAVADYFAPWWQKGLAAVAVSLVLLPAAALLTSPWVGSSFTFGFISMYLLYEILHRQAHTRPPRSAYGRWRRRNHFAHHFHDPRRAHGVTTPFWDLVFRTRLEVSPVRIPRRMASAWLLDETGDLLPQFVGDYVLVGASTSDAQSRRADHAAAMANRRPGG